MQITIDTSIDDAGTINRVGMFLVNLVATVAPRAAVAPAPDFTPADSLPADRFETGTSPADTKAASVFAGNVPTGTVEVAVPAYVPPAPVAIPPAPGTVAGPAERDSLGIPYDARIHNKGATKKQDGSWKLAKGIDPAVVAAVMLEITGTTPPPSYPEVVPVPVVPLVTAAPAPIAPAAPSAAIPVAPPATAPTPVPTGAVSFREVISKMTAAQTAGRITKPEIDAGLAQLGLKPDEFAPLVLPANAALLAAFNALIDSKA